MLIYNIGMSEAVLGRCLKFLALTLCLGLLQACTALEVKPWQRGTLSKPEMAGTPDSIEAKMRDHVFYSKEGSSGGASAGGGGCGCN
jgi:hypothetical protein